MNVDSQHNEGPAALPQFKNIKPRSRKERMAFCDKALREKELILNRPGAKTYRDNVPETQSGLTSMRPDAAGYISDADRFHTDVCGEEYLRRQAQRKKEVEVIERRRKELKQREDNRWAKMEAEKRDIEAQWMTSHGRETKARRNKSLVPYNPITLLYNDGVDGDRLRYDDDKVRYRAVQRTRNLLHHGSKYNVINGQESNVPSLPSEPEPSRQLSEWMKSSTTQAARG